MNNSTISRLKNIDPARYDFTNLKAALEDHAEMLEAIDYLNRNNGTNEQINALIAKANIFANRIEKEKEREQAAANGAVPYGDEYALSTPGRAPSRKVWQDKKGNDIPVYGKGEKMTNQAPDVSLGQFAKAMLVGTKDSKIKNALTEGTDSSGGFTVPSHTLTDFYDNLRAKSRLVQAGSQSIELETDETTIARVSSDPAVSWHSEGASEAASDVTFEGATFNTKTLLILVKASRELVADSVNIEQVLEDVFAGTIASEIDKAILFGATNGPAALTTAITNTTELGAGNGGALTDYDPLVTVYRLMLDDNATAPTAYLMAPREWETLATLKDANSRYLDRPQALSGIPFLETTNIPINETTGTSTNTSRIVTGNFEELVIGFRQEMRIELLREVFAESYEFGFLAHARLDYVTKHIDSFAQVTGITP